MTEHSKVDKQEVVRLAYEALITSHKSKRFYSYFSEFIVLNRNVRTQISRTRPSIAEALKGDLVTVGKDARIVIERENAKAR